MVRVLRVEVGMARCMLGLRMYRELQVGSGVEVGIARRLLRFVVSPGRAAAVASGLSATWLLSCLVRLVESRGRTAAVASGISAVWRWLR